jgi:hypothetical protein
MRAVEDSLGRPPPKREVVKTGILTLGLMARLGKSIAKQSEGRAGENICQWVGG